MQIGRKIYYDLKTGNVLVDTGERSGNVVPTSVDDDIKSYLALFERTLDTFGVVMLDYGQFTTEFSTCSGYRVNPDTGKVEFSFADPNAPAPPEPVYQEPFAVQIEKLKKENSFLKVQNQTLADRADFHEDILTEIIMTLYS